MENKNITFFLNEKPTHDCTDIQNLLFDFEKEVEPMLNVLCLKTIEQARMEVLIEEELRI